MRTVVIAAILETGRPERLYSGLSVLVSAAADGRPARGLVTFGALPLVLDPARAGEDRLGRSFAELLGAAAEIEECRLWACAAAVDLLDVDRDALAAPLEGVMSTPRFLRETAGAALIFV